MTYPFRNPFGAAPSLSSSSKSPREDPHWPTLGHMPNLVPTPMARGTKPGLVLRSSLKWVWGLPGLSYKNREWGRGGFTKEMATQQAKAPDVTSYRCNSYASVGALATLPPGTWVIFVGCVFPRICELRWGKVPAQGLAHGLSLMDTSMLPPSPSWPGPSLHSVCVLASSGKTPTLASAVARPAEVHVIPDFCPIPLAQNVPTTRGSRGPVLSPCHLCDLERVPSPR